MIPFTYLEPKTLEEALDLLARHGDDAKLVAGGTGLINLMKMRLVQPSLLVGLRALDQLKGVAIEGSLRIGALTTIRQLETSALVRRNLPLLADACHHVATVRVRSMATLGGAVSHADPHLDTPPALIALDAQIRICSRRGERVVSADAFFTGYFETVLQADEIVTEILVPIPPEWHGASFVKFLPATHDDYATVSVAARILLGADGTIAEAGVALGAAGSIPIKARSVERALRGASPNAMTFEQAAELVVDDIDPIEDFRGSAEFKRDMAAVHVRRALEQAFSRAKGAQ